jgi:N6-L-threonylcarbamoyladenine synthase
MNKSFTILGIDTSCDETSAAVVRNTVVLSNVVSSQVELHRKYGGVVPMIAKREHELRIDAVIEEALKLAGKNSQNKIGWQDIDAIAVTYGPGLAIALEVGVKKAKELALEHNIKLVGVNHMEGHLLSSLGLNSKGKGNIPDPFVLEFPLMGLLISGGHTELIIMQGFGKYEIIGQTVDDAIGEAYDKVARMLGLGYPGGKVLTEFAKKGNPESFVLPVPMSKDPGLNFSYSGLKTAVYYTVKQFEKQGKELKQTEIYNLAASFEHSAIAALQVKLKRALKLLHPKVLLVGGGVSSSAKVRAGLRLVTNKFKIKTYFPKVKNIQTDNGAMIAIAAYFKLLRNEVADQSLDRDPNLHL